MKITFLGTSSMLGFPRSSCKCSQCKSKDKKDKRTRSVLLINNNILIDAGPDILKQINRIKLKIKKIQSIIITHHHFDHTDGLKKLLPKLSKNCLIYLTNYTFNKLLFLKNFLNQKISHCL